MLRHFTLAVLMSLALVLSGQIASAEDNAEPPVSQNENDPAFTDKQPVDPVAIEKMAADVRQVPLTEDMVNPSSRRSKLCARSPRSSPTRSCRIR